MVDSRASGRPLIVHVLYRFATGGLENGVVNLINRMDPAAYRHMVVALTEVTDFRRRLQREDVECIALHKPPGHGWHAWAPMWRVLHARRPAIVHTRNLAALEMMPVAWAAGVPVRIHGEHGRDVDDVDGSNSKLQRVRCLYAPFVQQYVALSQDLAGYLRERVGIVPSRIAQIYNGVDETRFAPPGKRRALIADAPFGSDNLWLVGTVGRMQLVKNQTMLARAFVRMLSLRPALRARARLVMVGDGPLRAESLEILREGGAASLAWLPGERDDVADVMRTLDCFVLPSLAEGISNTILEAMATALPVIATAVGGNAELVTAGRTGEIVPSGDVEALAQAMLRLADSPERALTMGRAGRADVQDRFSLQAMVSAHQDLYDRMLAAAGTAKQER